MTQRPHPDPLPGGEGETDAAAALRANLAYVAAALRCAGGGTPGPDAVGPTIDGFDPEAFLPFARHHRVAEVLDALLEGSPALRARLSAQALASLHKARLAQAKRSERLLAQLERVTAAFGAVGVDAILLKGLGLAARLYGGLDRRATNDLDLLVREDHVERAERALADLGFRRVSWVPFRRVAVRVTHAFDYAGDGVTVDLHWTHARHPSLRIDIDGLWRRRQPLALGPVRIDGPGDEDARAISVVSAFRDLQRGAVRARALVDVHRLAAACGPGLDWAAFLERRRAEGTYAIAVNLLAHVLDVLDDRVALPAAADAIDRVRGGVVRLDAEAHRRLLAPSRLAIANRLWAIRLYGGSRARIFLWWLWSMPFRLLVYRSWRRLRWRKG